MERRGWSIGIQKEGKSENETFRENVLFTHRLLLSASYSFDDEWLSPEECEKSLDRRVPMNRLRPDLLNSLVFQRFSSSFFLMSSSLKLVISFIQTT